MQFKSYKDPSHTPWGAPDYRRELIPGVVFLGTPSHGGFWISEQRRKVMHGALCLDSPWYEEDVNWSLIYLAFPKEIQQAEPEKFFRRYVAAIQTVKNWLPEMYEEFFRVTIPHGQSYIKDKNTFLRVNEGKLAVFSAVGVDNGMVKVCAGKIDPEADDFRGIDTKSKLEFLVPKADYDQRGNFSFIVDPDKYEMVGA